MNTALKTPLCELLGCDYPVIQTAMGWVADARLVAASCNAGAFGFLAGAVMTPEEVEQGIVKIRQETDRPFGVNFHMFQRGAERIMEIIIEHKVKAVSYGRGPDADIISRFRNAGVVCIPTVGAVKHAQKAVELGANAVVVQGGEGGGHTGSVPTTLLLPQVIDAVDVPVIGAGGFKDGRGLVAALAFGAAGIAMGTRFLLTDESPVPRSTLERYLANTDPGKVIVSRRLDGMPQRMLKNELLGKLEKLSGVGLLLAAFKNGMAYRKLTGASMWDLLKSAFEMRHKNSLTIAQTMMAANAPMMIQKAMVEGVPAEGILPSGQVSAVINDLPSCRTLLEQIISEATQTLATLKQI